MPAYSKTPLAKKLGIKPQNTVMIDGFAPLDYFQALEVSNSDYNLVETADNHQVDFIHVFIKTKVELSACIENYMYLVSKSGMMWISWPKGSSGVAADVNRDSIREALLEAGLVDVKVASFDDVWSGLKFVWRLKDR